MKWNYRCPQCNNRHINDWEDRNKALVCPATRQGFHLPLPADQHDAFFDTQNWPHEMEAAVVALKGELCTIPGCGKKYETLDHRIPWSNNGRTSVKNLFPMCKEHNAGKGETQYNAWLAGRNHQSHSQIVPASVDSKSETPSEE